MMRPFQLRSLPVAGGRIGGVHVDGEPLRFPHRAWAEAARILVALPIEFHPADRGLADLAADFEARFTMSLADAFAAVPAKKLKTDLVTGDPEFKAVEKEITIN